MPEPAGTRSRIAQFLREARRRRVYTVAAAYIGLTIVLFELGPPIFEALQLPDGSDRVLTVLLLLGAPVVIVLAWLFDIGPDGVRLTPDLAPPAAREDARAFRTAVRPAAATLAGTPAPGVPPVLAPLVEEAPDPERVRRASLAFVRHELRTPINAIVGYSEMLLEDAREEQDAESARDLASILDGGRQLLEIIDDVLGAERVARDGTVDLERYSARIRADLRDPLSAVVGYCELLIEVSRERKMPARIPDLERILSAANRLLDLSSDIVNLATHAEPAGGLAHASSLAEGVLSKIRALQPDDGGGRQGTLLVVDDSATNRELLARQLARKGYLVATAESGAEALARMKQQAFDIVLLDVIMPEMDGIDVLQRMKGDPQLYEMPVIMISALDEIDSVVRCLEIGASDFLSKPFHPELLDARISAGLAVRRLQDRERALRAELESRAALAGTGAAGRVNAFPAAVLRRIDAGETRIIDAASHATVLWCDLEPALTGHGAPVERATLIESLVDGIHEAALHAGCGAAFTHGAAVVIVDGWPELGSEQTALNHAGARIAAAALSVIEYAGEHVRLGLHCGPGCSAVIGADRLSYWIWGDAFDIAQRLAAAGPVGQLHLSGAAHTLLRDRHPMIGRGVIDVDGRGQMRTYTLQRPVPVNA